MILLNFGVLVGLLSVFLIGGVGDSGVLVLLSLMIIFHAESFMLFTFVCV